MAGPPIVDDPAIAGFLPDWLDPVTIITWLNQYGLVEIGILAIIFAETGLLVGFFLPGDSILFTVGMFYANPVTADTFTVPFWLQVILIFITAFAGDQVGYLIGNRTGPRIFNKPDSKIFKREYVDKTYSYFERFGGRTVVLARFVPIVRTFAPVAAGVGKMHYRTFILYNFIGALLWGIGVTCLGYALGTVTFVAENIEFIFIGIVFVSVLPIVFELGRGALRGNKKENPSTADDSAVTPTAPVAALSLGPKTETERQSSAMPEEIPQNQAQPEIVDEPRVDEQQVDPHSIFRQTNDRPSPLGTSPFSYSPAEAVPYPHPDVVHPGSAESEARNQSETEIIPRIPGLRDLSGPEEPTR